jgi:tyrosyl-tRNA synthetase
MKMSKSDKHSALFVHDTEEEIREKVRRAFCPPDSVEFNPMLDWVRKLIFARDGEFRVERSPQHGGPLRFSAPEEANEAYMTGGLHPADLKNGVADWLVGALEPARKAFEQPEQRALLEELEALGAR